MCGNGKNRFSLSYRSRVIHQVHRLPFYSLKGHTTIYVYNGWPRGLSQKEICLFTEFLRIDPEAGLGNGYSMLYYNL